MNDTDLALTEALKAAGHSDVADSLQRKVTRDEQPPATPLGELMEAALAAKHASEQEDADAGDR